MDPWVRWEALAHEVAHESRERGWGILQCLDLVRYGEIRFDYQTDGDDDFMRGWIAWVIDPERAALADAMVVNEHAYAAGALARILFDESESESE
jgi:hypothetical protein